jgi:hypothetical protein
MNYITQKEPEPSNFICNKKSFKEIIMSTRRETTILYYVIAIVVILVIFLLLGGGPWIKGLTHGNSSFGSTDLHWGQILISLGLGFLLGWIVSRRKW